jgi:hypothetical protein
MLHSTSNLNLNKIFKSASITFFDKNLGFLLCKENRDRKIVYHPIGGKYENEDIEINMTAAREFVEETGIMKCGDFIEYIKKSSFYDPNEKIMKCASKILNELLLNTHISYYYDHYVNKDRDYVHRYYLVNIELMDSDLAKIIKKIDIFYKNTYGTHKNEYIDDLVWNKDIIKNKRLYKNQYSMLTIYLSLFLRNINNSIKYE